jgi:IPT/TIG domain
MKNRCPRLALPLLCWTLLFSTLVGCGGSGSGSNGDTAPGSLTITAISPSTLTANPPGPVQITITGTGFISTSQVQVNGSSVPTTFVSATTLEAAVPATQIVAGAKLVVTVVNGSVATAPSGAASTLVVNNPVPAITSLQPSMVLAGAGATDVLITGTGFLPTSAVTVNGGARTVTYTSATEISVSLSAADLATAGTLNLVATNAAPGGGSSPAVTFAVDNPMPVIASLAPASVIEGAAAFTLDVKGTGFTTGSTVHWNATALTGILVSPNQIDAAVPATLISANGSVQVVVTTPAPGGGQSTPATFSILAPKPVLNSISPATVPYNQPATVTLLGGGFDANSVVQWKGGAEPTTFISTSQLSVTLTAADLSTIGSGQLTVTNRAPGGGTSAALALNITNQTIPAITSVDVSVQSPGTACPQVLVHATGTNFINALLTVNGQLLQGSGNGSDIFAFLPAGFTAAPGNFVAVATNAPNASSNPYSLPASAPPVLAFCTSPAGADIYPGSTFATNFAATRVNIAGPASINSITLPAGISTATALPFSLAQAGTRIAFKAAGTLAAGTLSIPLSGSAGAVTAPGSISVTVVSSPPPSFYFTSQIITELGIAVGGSGSISYFTAANSGPTPADYTVDLTVSGLPPGTTATVNPSTVIPGDNFSVTVTASATAPESQNVPITITGTPSAATAAVTSQFTLDVTPKPGSLPGNRTDFTSTGGTPDAVVYDRQLDLIFASNPTWNRIDIISNKTHLLQQSVPVPGPQALDLSQDGSTLWIGTSSRHILSLNTTTLGLTRYMAPVITSSIQFPTWEDNTLLALADGTLLINVSPSAGSGIYGNAIWNPATNQVTMLSGPSQFFNLRSGDGTKAYGSYGNSVYDVSTKAVTPLPTLGQGTSVAAVNQDGSLLLGADNSVYQASGTLIGPLPSYLGSTYYSNIGSSVFSPDGKTLYQIGQGQYGSFIATVDVPTLSLTGVAPAMATEPNFVSETPVNSIDLSVDNTAMLIGIQTYGIGFEDATFFQNYGATPKSQEPPVAFTPNAGPLSGGTASSPYGFFDLIPDVWYGQNRGTASLDSSNSLTVVSPPGNADGPVNLKYIYPSGAQAFTAQAFSYSAYPQYPILTGSSPTGGVHGTISGYGMPADASGGTLTIGNNTAAITTTVGQYPPYTPEAFPSTYLDFTIPAGNPGYADLTVSTPNGNGTLPRAVFYAKSVTDYSTADAATDVLYDPARQQVYLSGTDHIDVFSLASKQWLNPIKPATLGTQSQFRGMALTADGTQLLATNILDNSLGVINPDAPSQTFAISIPAGVPTGPGCGTGPFAVAALAGSRAFVSSGLPPVIGGCPYNETLYFVNLASRSAATVTSSQIPNAYQCGNDGSINEATSDGTLAIVGGEEGGSCLYSSTGNAFALVNNNAIDYYGVALSGDGNIAAVSNGFSDPSGNALGSLARPAVQYPGATVTPYPLNNYPQNTLHRPRLNTSGSLYYWAYPNWFEIFDVQKGTLQLRFSLSETIQDVETPLATDPSGQLVFLITGAGLTVVDLGTAPLSIGYLSSTTATAGLAIQVRGSGFTAGITATLGGQSASVTFTDANTLTLTAPALTSGPHDLTLTRADGVSYTLASAIVTQ